MKFTWVTAVVQINVTVFRWPATFSWNENCYAAKQGWEFLVGLWPGSYQTVLKTSRGKEWGSSPTTPQRLTWRWGGRNILLVLLMVFRTSRFCHEPLCQFFQVSGILHLYFRLLAEEVLQILKKLHSHFSLLLQAFLLLYELSSDL